ncbi:single-stranded DNA-binding protein [Paraburkholderia sp. Ac-20342]|uniref:single-stranded DNA-binding protein n=1 Tax=Paraburkholderia sp. Ac-20342 TaxID=2703889 RepID=UPI0019813BB9|nr:single-stranded DNA-binding protein [Paraburkholderia sp. Ac-20342]MBN3850146.1 single-stranded DNA-binding protein [Paraburkholderia sp. Ac-20342]
MIDGLVGGKVYGKPAERAGQNGKSFVTAKVRATMGDGDALFVNVIAFSTTVQQALMALDDGDSVALSGVLTPKVWTDKNGEARPALDMVAHGVLTAYHVQRRRRAMQSEDSMPTGGARDDMNDEL